MQKEKRSTKQKSIKNVAKIKPDLNKMETCVWCFIKNILESMIFSPTWKLQQRSARLKKKKKYKMRVMIRDFSQYISTNQL